MKTVQSVSSIVFNGSELVSYEECDREQIHLSGHIQPHGLLIGINELDLKIVQISENTTDFFNVPAIALIDQPLSALFPQSQIEDLVSFLSQQDLEIFNPIKVAVQIQTKNYSFNGVMHRSDGLLILELEPLLSESNSTLGFYYHAKSAILNVRRSQDFEEMCDLLVREIRELIQYDRVVIYKFDLDKSGIVIAEAKAEHLESFLGLHYPASDIPEPARQLYYKNWLRLIVDVNYQPVSILASNSIPQVPLNLSFSTLRSVSPFHIKYLQNMGVAASFSISLVNVGKLWGLVACHNYSPKYINYEIRKACELLGQIMSVEIVNKYEQELKIAQEKIKNVQSKLKQNILNGYQSINHTFIQNIDDLLDLVNAQGVAICLGKSISKIGVCPSQEFITSLISWIELKSQDIFLTNCLSQTYPEAIAIKDIASGLLAISISLNHTSYHILWFRPEVIQTVNWAGFPSKLTDENLCPSPRRSFELWQETVRTKSLPWNEVEIDAALELRSTLMLAALEFSQQSLKKEAERSEVANKAKSIFLARMSHELRTPLNAILGCTQLMTHDTSLTSDLGEYVSIISYSSEHLLNLIDDVLEVSKIEAGKILLEETEFDLHLLLNNLQEMLQIKANDKKLQLIFIIYPSLPQYIKSDERKVRQILLNLLSNAIKFTSKGYVILRVSLKSVEPKSSKATIHFEIEDTGKGVALEEIDDLFEAFVQTASGR